MYLHQYEVHYDTVFELRKQNLRIISRKIELLFHPFSDWKEIPQTELIIILIQLSW